MSRIGRMPIAVPAGVTVEIAENNKGVCKINDLHLFTPVPFSNIFHGDTTPAPG